VSSSFLPSESLFRAVIDNAHDVFALLDADGKILYVSRAVTQYGHDPQMITGRRIWETIHPDDVAQVRQVYADLVQRPGETSRVEHRVWNIAGYWRFKETTLKNLLQEPTVQAVVAIALDVTEQKLAEQQLRESHDQVQQRLAESSELLELSEARYRRLIEGLQVDYVFYSQALDGTIDYISPSVRNVLGYPADSVRETGLRPYLTDNPLNDQLDRSFQAALNGQPPQHRECELRHADGSPRILEYMEVPIFDDDGTVIAVEGIARDVTARKRAETQLQQLNDELEQRVQDRTETLSELNRQLYEEIQKRKAADEKTRQSEERFRSVVNDQTEFIVRWLPDGTRIFVNDSYCRFFGETRETLIGTSFFPQVTDAEDRERIRRLTGGLTPDHPVTRYEHRVNLADGSTAWVQWNDRALFDAQGNLVAFQSVGRDITGEKEADEHLQRLQDELAHVGRVSVMGEMVAAIGHEIGQPLHAIHTFASASTKALEANRPDSVAKALEWSGKIQQQAQRAAEIIRRLREFTRLTESNRQPLSINGVIREALELMRPELRRNRIRSERRLANGLPDILGDWIQMEQVLVNLLRNACEAMEAASQDRRCVLLTSRRIGEEIQVCVQDQGCGMDPDSLSKAFEAFYTTKPQGTGIGLAICSRIIKEHGGRMWAETNADHGMRFCFALPTINEDPQAG
jgi:PAS domain S-box-containing protein